jgi:predicted Ser/Thr protein kinase
MPLSGGTRLGPYEIVSSIGAGGMGEVYKARDTRLGREVALKILPVDLAADPLRRRRFEQEARAVAALNHPNIVALYDVGDGYIVTELVDGESLRALTPSLKRALEIAAQIASGLAAAHNAGIVHRDLKPENIMLARDGRVKILDFGIAKMHVGESGAATVSLQTEPGVIVGTVSYMSPEQIRGASVDARSDIFSLGLMLYEMLAGRRAFEAETSAEIMAAILRQDPVDLPESVPGGVRRMVARCLEKNPAARFQSASDLAFALSQGDTQTGRTPAIRSSRGFLRFALAGALCVALGFGAAAMLMRAPAPVSWTQTMLGGPEIACNPRISPDGRTLAMIALIGDQSQVAVMRPEAGDWAILTHATNDGTAVGLSWSTDGSRIYFDRTKDVPTGIYSVPMLGGEPSLVLENAAYPEALPDGSLLVVRLNPRAEWQIFRFWPDSGKLQEFPFEVQFNTLSVYRAFPGGHAAAMIASPIPAQAQGGAQLYYLDLDSGRSRLLTDRRNLDLSTVTVSGDGRQVIFSVAGEGIWSVDASGRSPARRLFNTIGLPYGIDAAPDGAIVVDQTQRPTELIRLVDRHAQPIAAPAITIRSPFAILPDGRAAWNETISGRTRIAAFERGKPPAPLFNTSEQTSTPATLAGPGMLAFLVGDPGKQQIAIGSLSSRRIAARIPFDKGVIVEMASSPFGKTLYCVADHAIWAVPAAGGAPARIHDGDAVTIDPDGKFLLAITEIMAKLQIYKIPLDGGAPAEIVLQGDLRPTQFLGPHGVSRDGRLLMPLASAVSWYYLPGVIDLATGRAELVPTDLTGDYRSMNWTPDGQIMAIAAPFHSSIWKFSPASQK